MMLKLDLLAELENLEILSQRIQQFCAAQNFSDTLEYSLQLIAEELFVNAATHAQGSDRPQCQLLVTPTVTGWHVTFVTHGPRFDPRDAAIPDIHAEASARTAGGLGLHFVRQLTQNFAYDYRHGANYVTCDLGLAEQ